MSKNFKEELDEFDFINYSIDQIEEFFSRRILGHERPTINLSPEGLFRARIINGKTEEELSTTKCIWYPDYNEIDEKYHRLNRCSNKGQNFFYCSNYLGAVVKELSPHCGNILLVGIFQRKFQETKIRSQYAGIEALKRIPHQHTELKNYKYPDKDDELIEKFISQKFQERVPPGQEYKYKPSIAFSNILLKNNDINCLIYPSVASDLESVNYGIKAVFVDKYLYCPSVYIYQVKRDFNHIELIPLRYGKEILLNNESARDSIIIWEDNSETDQQETIAYRL